MGFALIRPDGNWETPLQLLNLKHKGKMAEDDVLLTELNLKASFKVMLMGCVRLPSSRPCKTNQAAAASWVTVERGCVGRGMDGVQNAGGGH